MSDPPQRHQPIGEGNHDRAWNDPPLFSVQANVRPGGPRTTRLNQRVAYPLDGQSPLAQMVGGSMGGGGPGVLAAQMAANIPANGPPPTDGAGPRHREESFPVPPLLPIRPPPPATEPRGITFEEARQVLDQFPVPRGDVLPIFDGMRREPGSDAANNNADDGLE